MKRGRKSKYDIEINKSKVWNVAVYIRLSVQDGDKAESNSVINQKELLNMYLEQDKELNVKEYYIDDGFSGTTFDRPAFKKMMKDIEKEIVNTVIVKDLSRFGRNYIEVGNKINSFMKNNIRFISVCEKIDSYKDKKSVDDIIFPLKNIMNEMYCKDVSDKLIKTFEVMKKEGKYIGGIPPFGYIRDENNKHKLIVDEASASVVRRIFDLCESGIGNVLITKELNEKNVLTPSEYNCKILKITSSSSKVAKQWTASIVGKILDNRVYCGDLVQNKTRGISYKVHKRLKNDEEDYIIIENAHEPIIEKERFFNIQKIRKDRKFNWNRRIENISIFDGIVFCSNCNKPLVATIKEKSMINDTEIDKYVLECKECNNQNDKPYVIDVDKLKICIFRSIKYHIDLLNGFENARLSVKENKEYADKIKENVENLKNKLERLDKERTKYFTKFRDMEIDEQEYIAFIRENVKEEENIKEQIKKEKAKLMEARLSYKNVAENNWVDTLMKYKNQRKITKEMLNDLIEKIYINNDGRKIKLVFKYEDAFKLAMDYLKIVKEGGNTNA